MPRDHLATHSAARFIASYSRFFLFPRAIFWINVAALVIRLCRIMSRLAIWPARRNTLVFPICHAVRPASRRMERATVNSSPGVNSFSLSGASKPNRSRNSSTGLREGYPAHEMRTASRTPPHLN